ncbi:uncharacterized protein A4U43_C03F23550 [Asparagus officinalis]|uniref:Uncharacterized protein n=1 Tax=Asparagus officinalis TaxID=4686 RepID=A0A5P1FCH7_ASPOF|nr:uncharacterized protein A4U43_C03F23550 [Asparagus officinalis]
MHYNLTNMEDSVKISILKHGGGFRQEGHFRTNIIGLCPSLVNEDAPVREVAVVLNTLGNELAKIGSKEPIPLDDKEEQVDYGHNDTNAYLTNPDDVGNLGDIGSSLYMPDDESDFGTIGEAIPTYFPTSGCFETVIDFEGASGILASVPATEMTEASTPTPVLLVQ